MGRRCLAIRILSVRPSVKRVHCDKMEERSVQIFIPHDRSFSYSFLRRMLGGGRPTPSTDKFWVNRHMLE